MWCWGGTHSGWQWVVGYPLGSAVASPTHFSQGSLPLPGHILPTLPQLHISICVLCTDPAARPLWRKTDVPPVSPACARATTHMLVTPQSLSWSPMPGRASSCVSALTAIDLWERCNGWMLEQTPERCLCFLPVHCAARWSPAQKACIRGGARAAATSATQCLWAGAGFLAALQNSQQCAASAVQSITTYNNSAWSSD